MTPPNFPLHLRLLVPLVMRRVSLLRMHRLLS
jgi:hypothetical protein